MQTTPKNIHLGFEDFESDRVDLNLTPHGILVTITPEFSIEGEVSVLFDREYARRMRDFLTADVDFNEVGLYSVTLVDNWGDELVIYRNDAVTLTLHLQMHGRERQSVLLYAWQWNEVVEALGQFNY
jgi:hypothetical protein